MFLGMDYILWGMTELGNKVLERTKSYSYQIAVYLMLHSIRRHVINHL